MKTLVDHNVVHHVASNIYDDLSYVFLFVGRLRHRSIHSNIKRNTTVNTYKQQQKIAMRTGSHKMGDLKRRPEGLGQAAPRGKRHNCARHLVVDAFFSNLHANKSRE